MYFDFSYFFMKLFEFHADDFHDEFLISGITQGSPMMLVMELAPEGPLHKYLKKKRSVL